MLIGLNEMEKPTPFSGLVLGYTKGRKWAVSQISFISASSLWIQHHQLLQTLHQRGLEPWTIIKMNAFSSMLLWLRRFISATRKGGAPGACVSGGRGRGLWVELCRSLGLMKGECRYIWGRCWHISPIMNLIGLKYKLGQGRICSGFSSHHHDTCLQCPQPSKQLSMGPWHLIAFEDA